MESNNSLNAVLRVLAITIFVDSRLHKNEPEEFRKQVRRLGVFSSGDSSFSEEKIEDWFLRNWEGVLKALLGGDRESFVADSLARIDDEFLAPMLYSSMCQICNCDNELHTDERALLLNAARVWGLN